MRNQKTTKKLYAQTNAGAGSELKEAQAGRAYLILRTLAITWPQGVLSGEDNLAVTAQVHGVVGWFHG